MDDLIAYLGLPKNVLSPNRHDLDVEFEHHPQHIAAVADALAEARLDRERVKAELSATEARVRRAYLSSGDGRKTVAEVAAVVASDRDVVRQEGILRTCDYKVERLAGLLSALQVKTSALKHLSELYQASYYVSNHDTVKRAHRR